MDYVDHQQRKEIMIKLLGKKLLVKRIEEDTKTAAGIVLTGEQEGPAKGIVQVAGEDSEINQGDTILFPKAGVNKVKILGEDLLLLTDDHVLCIIEED